MNANSSVLFGPRSGYASPMLLLRHIVGEPEFETYTKEKVSRKTGVIKKRVINAPNDASKELHHLFLEALKKALYRMGDGGKFLRILPSATAFKNGSWHLRNTEKHFGGEHFYITDIRNAYGSIDLELLTELLVFVFNYETYRKEYRYQDILRMHGLAEKLRAEPLFSEMFAFLTLYFSGERGKGLVFGGVASPYLFNLFMEVFLDGELRYLIGKRDLDARIIYTRYADDLVFSSKKYIGPVLRRKIRERLTRVGFNPHHFKSKVLTRSMGTVFITGYGIHREEAWRLVFPSEKRRAPHNKLHQFFQGKESSFKNTKSKDPRNIVLGYVAEFLGYYKALEAKQMTPTKSDEKLLELCKRFEVMAGIRQNPPRQRRSKCK